MAIFNLDYNALWESICNWSKRQDVLQHAQCSLCGM